MKILNSKGEEIVLNERETKVANYNQSIVNALGVDVNITTLTTIVKKVTTQKFFTIKPALYLPVVVGNGAWSQQLTTYKSFDIADDFGTGVLKTGGKDSKLAQGDTGIETVNVAVKNWAKGIGWNLFDLELATKSGNWDLITAKEKSRKQNWDLGIQKIAFLGLDGDSSVKGLLNMAGIDNNTSVITKKISAMTSVELSTFLGAILPAYRLNCAYTAMPTHFIIPESDYLGLAAPSSDTNPLKSKLQLILETFQVMTGNMDFKVLPCAYGDQSSYFGGSTNIRYCLLNYDEESVRMDIPVDYSSTLANSIDNFMFRNVGYGQFTGCAAYRPKEIQYFTHT